MEFRHYGMTGMTGMTGSRDHTIVAHGITCVGMDVRA